MKLKRLRYLRVQAMMKVIAGTEFCTAEANVGDAYVSPKR